MDDIRVSSVICDERYDNQVCRLDSEGFHPHFLYVTKVSIVSMTTMFFCLFEKKNNYGSFPWHLKNLAVVWYSVVSVLQQTCCKWLFKFYSVLLNFCIKECFNACQEMYINVHLYHVSHFHNVDPKFSYKNKIQNVQC